MAIYCDNAATTRTRPEVADAMIRVFAEDFGNASSLHKFGRRANKLLELARKKAAQALNCYPDEIFFTSGGTESNNLALRGTDTERFITSPIEHSAVYAPLRELERCGREVLYLPVDGEGFVDLSALEAHLSRGPALVSIMHANNEIGTVQDLTAIGELCHRYGATFHTDAVQSAGKLPLDMASLPVDMLSVSGHKIYGPKGVGILYVRRSIQLRPLIYGGTQEGGCKPGTENLPGIVGIGVALELASESLDSEAQRLRELQAELISRLLQVPGLSLNGPSDLRWRVPGNVNVSFPGTPGDQVVMNLDLKGICASSGSACSSGTMSPSRPVAAILPANQEHLAYNALRLSLGRENTAEEIPQIAAAVAEVAAKLSEISERVATTS